MVTGTVYEVCNERYTIQDRWISQSINVLSIIHLYLSGCTAVDRSYPYHQPATI